MKSFGTLTAAAVLALAAAAVTGAPAQAGEYGYGGYEYGRYAPAPYRVQGCVVERVYEPRGCAEPCVRRYTVKPARKPNCAPKYPSGCSGYTRGYGYPQGYVRSYR